jgi:hypothetical protein
MHIAHDGPGADQYGEQLVDQDEPEVPAIAHRFLDDSSRFRR